MNRDTARPRGLCLGLVALLAQGMIGPAAVAKKKHKETESAPPAAASTAAATPAASPPVAEAKPAAPAAPAQASSPGVPTTTPAAAPATPAAPPAAPPPPAAAPAAAAAAAPPAAAPPAETIPPPPPAAAGTPEAAMPPDQQMPGPDAFESAGLDVVKVTVDRREKDIQSYAGSASAFSQDDLQRVGVNSVKDLSAVAPSVEVGVQEGNVELFIRGVGSTNNTELGDPSASTHIDGIYIPRPRGVGSMFFDLERVEMNRGPQGTLRGRNAVAGSLNLITAKPKLNEFGAEAQIQLGNYSQRMTRAMVNIPLGEKLALRFASYSENRDPFYKNGGPVYTLKPTESADSLAYRASAKWIPTDRITVNVSHDLTQEKGTGYSGSNFTPALNAGLLPSEIKDPRSVIYRGPQADQNMRTWGFKGDLNLDLGPVQAQYLGGYRALNYRQVTGGNAGITFPGRPPANVDDWSTSYWHTTSHSQVHELRFFAPDTARFRWTAGGFFFREKQTGFLGSVQDQSNAFAGVEFNMPHVLGQSEAGYVDATFDISKIWRAFGGFRLTHESKERTGGIGNVYGLSVPIGGGNFRLGTEGFRFIEGRSSYNNVVGATDGWEQLKNGVVFGARDTVNVPGTTRAWGDLVPENGWYKNTFPDFRIGTDYDVAPGHLAYVSVTTGHASGGFNDNILIPGANPGDPITTKAPTYRPEQLLAFEVGSKNEFLEHRLKANLAVFDYEYKDMVLQNVIAIPIPNAMDNQNAAFAVRDNIGRARIIGAEFDGSYRLPYGLVVSLAGTFLHARALEGEIFDGRVAFSPTGGTTDKVKINGKVLPRSPTLTVNYSLAQNIKSAVGWFDWIISAQTRTKYYMTIFNGEGIDTTGAVNPLLSDDVPSYTRVDVGAGYARPDGKIRLDLFASNLTNVAYMSSIINTPGLNLRFFNPPRQVGVRLSLFW